MQELNSRIQSNIPGPVSDYGRSLPQQIERKYAIYDGQPITAFLWSHGLPSFGIREFLKANEIGSAFSDLEDGDRVVLESQSTFTQHPDY